MAVSLPRGFAAPNVVDAKHVTVDWCGFTDASSLNCDNVTQPTVSLPTDAMQFQFAEKEWNPRITNNASPLANTAAKSWAYYQPNNLNKIYASANTDNATHPYDICGPSLNWLGDAAGANNSVGGADYDKSYTPFVTECADILASSIRSGFLVSNNMSNANNTNTMMDTNVGTADPNGPLESKREYVFREVMADTLGNFSTPNSMNGTPTVSHAKGTAGGIDVGSPWVQVLNGAIYVSGSVNVNVQNVPYSADGTSSSFSYLPASTGNSLVRNGACAIAGSGQNNFGILPVYTGTNVTDSKNGTCNSGGDTSTNLQTGSAVSQIVTTNQYTFSAFLDKCKKNGECTGAATPWIGANGQLQAVTGADCVTTDSTGSVIDLGEQCIKTNGWLYTSGNLYVGFNPTAANCANGTSGSSCIPDVNRPEDPVCSTNSIGIPPGEPGACTPGTSVNNKYISYTGKAIILVGGNLYVQPDLNYVNPATDGYIFIVKGNIRVLSTKQTTPPNSVHYDYVDGYFYDASGGSVGTGGSLTVDRQRCYENTSGLTINGCTNYP